MSTPLPPPSPSPHPVALITASSAGLGAACALALAPTHSIIVNYFSREEKAREVLERCNAINNPNPNPSSSSSSSPTFKNSIIQSDASSRQGVAHLITSATATHSRLDIVISNAGWTRVTDFSDLDAEGALDDELWDRCWRANVKSHLWLFHAARPWLERSAKDADAGGGGRGGGGAFVTVSSTAGVRPGGSSLAYSVSKAGLIHLTRALAGIAGGQGVRVNCVSPGLLMTEWGQRFSQDKVDAVVQRSALKRVATVEEVAEQVKLLCMNRGITGQNVVVDGGMVI